MAPFRHNHSLLSVACPVLYNNPNFGLHFLPSPWLPETGGGGRGKLFALPTHSSHGPADEVPGRREKEQNPRWCPHPQTSVSSGWKVPKGDSWAHLCYSAIPQTGGVSVVPRSLSQCRPGIWFTSLAAPYYPSHIGCPGDFSLV